MNPLALRRRVERGRPFFTTSSGEKQMSSAAQIAANQANAQLSSGPKTPEGKAKSSRNALKTGLTGRTIMLAKDQAEIYEQHVLNYALQFDPKALARRNWSS